MKTTLRVMMCVLALSLADPFIEAQVCPSSTNSGKLICGIPQLYGPAGLILPNPNHQAHFQVDASTAPVDHRARNAGAGDLGGGGSDGDGWRNAVKDQQRCGEKSAADAEHAGQYAHDEAEHDDEEGVDRLAGDREIDVHWRALTNRKWR